ncbi:hypothetical protein [Actinomadura litoris]|uniref:hypothetical protein n=1 Tax=Actinomadura litoris TaxID=2678616 RepID=UPI001FA74A24|nr:hypothetical protein [Actinomadura litoris]
MESPLTHIDYHYDRPPHMPTAEPLHMDIRPSGMVVVSVNRKLTLSDICEEFSISSAQSVASDTWTHLPVDRRFMATTFLVDTAPPRGRRIRAEERGPVADIFLRADLGIDEALGRLMLLLTREVGPHWQLNMSTSA